MRDGVVQVEDGGYTWRYQPYDPDPLDVAEQEPDPEPRPILSFRGCVWLAITAALAVFWVGVALIVGGWLG